MARRRLKPGDDMDNQPSLFDLVEEINPDKFDAPDFQEESKPLGLRIKDGISEGIKNSGLKRYAIAGEMSEQLGVEITESMLNSWTAESKEGHRMPAEYYPIFCKLTQDFAILEILTASAGGRMVKSEEIYLLEMGRLQQAEKAIQVKRTQLQREWQRSHAGVK